MIFCALSHNIEGMSKERPAGFDLTVASAPLNELARWLGARDLSLWPASADLSEWFVAPDARSKKIAATDDDRKALTAWLKGQKDVASFSVGRLRTTAPKSVPLAFVKFDSKRRDAR